MKVYNANLDDVRSSKNVIVTGPRHNHYEL